MLPTFSWVLIGFTSGGAIPPLVLLSNPPWMRLPSWNMSVGWPSSWSIPLSTLLSGHVYRLERYQSSTNPSFWCRLDMHPKNWAPSLLPLETNVFLPFLAWYHASRALKLSPPVRLLQLCHLPWRYYAQDDPKNTIVYHLTWHCCHACKGNSV